MAIEDIIQIKDTVSKDGIIPLDRNQDVLNAQNQVDFLRTQKEMGLSENAVMAKLIQMFVEEPTRFTQEFGKESAEAIREFLGFETQGDMEKKGYVFDDNSSEIIGLANSNSNKVSSRQMRQTIILGLIVLLYVVLLDQINFTWRYHAPFYTFSLGSFELISIPLIGGILYYFWRGTIFKCLTVSAFMTFFLAIVFRDGFQILLPGSG